MNIISQATMYRDLRICHERDRRLYAPSSRHRIYVSVTKN